jgi:ABC-type branched-subunit amino acid transport system ATPase component
MMNTSPILTLKNIDMVFGGVQALKNVNIDVMDGEILGIIGPNGAGKKTQHSHPLCLGIISAHEACKAREDPLK